MGTGTCSPDLDFPSVTVVRSPESVRIGGVRGRDREQLAVQCRPYGSCQPASVFLLGEHQDFEYTAVRIYSLVY